MTRQESSKKYYDANKERIAAYHREHYKLVKEAHLKRSNSWWKAHPEKRREKDNRRRAKNPSKFILKAKIYRDKNLEKVRRARRAWHHSNREHRSAYMDGYYSRNAEVMKERSRQWAKDNKDKLVSRNIRRANLKREASGNLKLLKAFVKSVTSKPFAVCYYCDKTISTTIIHFDHMIPLSKGGQHSVENLCVSCATCNLRKHDRSIGEWKRIGQQLLIL